MFNKENTEITQSEAETVIGPSIKVKGNFHGEGSMIIEGNVEGSVKTKNFLLVGSSSEIVANIEAKNAKVSGLVKGNIVVEGYLEITKTAKIEGDIQTQTISVENGAIIKGLVTTGKTNQPITQN